jgi:hypothetical protein
MPWRTCRWESVTAHALDHVRRAWLPRLRSGRLAVLLLAVALVPFVQDLTAQPAIRYAQTAAMVEQRSIVLDDYEQAIGVDRVERDGHVYGDKAPLQPILAIPAYASARAVGAESASVLRVQENLGLWWVTLWSSVVPLLAIAALGVHVAGRVVGRDRSVAAALAISGGTLLVAYGTQLYAHVLAGLLGWACWLAADRSLRARPGDRPVLVALGAGALGGAAVATEYPLAIVIVVVAGVLVAQRAWSRLAAFAVGGSPFVVLLLGYQWLAYGSPFAVSYSEKPVHDAEPLVVGIPSPLRLLEVLGGSRGLLLFSPVVALAAWGLWRLARSEGAERRRHGIVGLAVLGSFLVLQASWVNPWGGEAPGPRYVIPSLPFLIVGMAEVWSVAPAARRVAVRWSVLAMAMPVVALHLTPQGTFAVASQLQSLREFGPTPTLWTMALGPLGWVVHTATIAGVAALLVGALRVERDLRSARADRTSTAAEPVAPAALGLTPA